MAADVRSPPPPPARSAYIRSLWTPTRLRSRIAVIAPWPEPRVGRIAALFPVAGLKLVAQRNPVYPLDVLEAVHVGDYQAQRIALLGRERFVVQLVPEEHIRQVCLVHRQALGIAAVGR